MPIIVSCACGQRSMAPDTLAGKRTNCPKCGAMLTIPAVAAQPQQNMPVQNMPVQNMPVQSMPVQNDPLGLGDLGQYEQAGNAEHPLIEGGVRRVCGQGVCGGHDALLCHLRVLGRC